VIEIHRDLFVGDQTDYEQTVRWATGWRVVQACRDPYHLAALGYTTRSAPRNHPEYLAARRGNRLILNLIDHDDPKYIRRQVLDAALAFIESALADGQRVLVHCNRGHSRAPAICLYYLAAKTDVFAGLEYRDAKRQFRVIYPMYVPAAGIEQFVTVHWPRQSVPRF
jgi:predicted protein tyrosine phosphatase